MLNILLSRVIQGHRTIKYPDAPAPAVPDRLRGRLVLDRSRCVAGCSACVDICPTGALTSQGIDLGKCLFCTDCTTVCPTQALTHSTDYRLAVRQRGDLIVSHDEAVVKLAESLTGRMKKLFGRSLKLRQVCAGGGNACEADVNVLSTIGWDLGRFGIQMVASPRHADGLLITGPVTKNMALALKKTYDAVAEPKVVIVVGSCAISGGPYIDHDQANNGAEGFVPVDLYIPGCPPHPLTILDGLLRLVGRLDRRM